MTDDEERFYGVMIERDGRLAVLAEDGACALIYSSLDETEAVVRLSTAEKIRAKQARGTGRSTWLDLLAELHRCGLRSDAEVVDDYPATDLDPTASPDLWVTVMR